MALSEFIQRQVRHLALDLRQTATRVERVGDQVIPNDKELAKRLRVHSRNLRDFADVLDPSEVRDG